MKNNNLTLIGISTLFIITNPSYAELGSRTWQQNPEPVEMTRYNNGFAPVLQANWFGAIDGGLQFPNVTTRININNGSGFPAPYSLDSYSTNNKTQGFMGVEAGRFWQRRAPWFSAYGLGLRYRYMFPTNVGNKVTQYFLSPYENYNYTWKSSSNVVTGQAKLNVAQYSMLSPYVGLGLGVASNSTKTYTEAALTGVTPRISPAFAARTNNNFAYNFGAGFDFKLNQSSILSLGYEYQNFGAIQSDYGTSTWSTDLLNLGTYSSNAILLNFLYLFDN